LTGPSSPNSSRFNTSASSSTVTQHHAYSVTTNRPQPAPTTSTRARALRRAARSALVDTYRLFVLTELINRLPGPVVEEDLGRPCQNIASTAKTVQRRDPINFTVWVLHSIRRRALERMERILEEADLEYKSRNPTRMGRLSDEISRGLVATTMEVPLSFSDDEEDITDRTSTVSSSNTVPELDSPMEVDSDSDDGSSLHTPSSSSHTHAWPAPGNRSVSDTSSVASSNDSVSLSSPPVPPKDKRMEVIRLSKIPQPPSKQHFISAPVPTPSQTQHLSPAALHEYTDLLDLRTRLGQLLLFAGSQTRVIAEEKRTRLEILAVKSRRRAWSNRALSLVARSQAGLGGQYGYGLATTFRSSPLARYMWTVEDLERMPSSSKSSSPTSTISSRSSVRSTNRPRLRPKIQYDLEAMMMPEVNTEPFVGQNRSVEDEDLFDSDMEPVAFTEMKESVDSSSLGISSTKRQPTARKVGVSSRSPSEKNASIIGRLFPVSEENDGEVQDHYPTEDEEIYHFTASRSTRTRESQSRTFMGCDEIKVHDNEGNTFEVPRETEIQLGFTEFGDRQIPSDIDPETETGSEVRITEQTRSKPSSRARTTSMMGALLQRAKSSLQSNKEKEIRPELSKNSILCQSVPSSVLNQLPAPVQVPAPKLQMQSQLRLKRSVSPSGDNQVQKSVKIPRPTPAIYEDTEVNMELDLQFRVGEYRQSESIEFIGIQDVSPGMPVDPENEKVEFTLAMDLPKTTRRRRERANFEYPTKPLSRRDFEDNLRPKLNTIFVQPDTVSS